MTTVRHNTGRRWLARWVDSAGRERSKSFDRKRDADAHIKQVTADLVTGAYVDTKRSAATFGSVAEVWLTAKTPGLKSSTAGGYRSLLDHTLLPRWRDVKLADITHADVQQWVTWMTTNKEARKPRTDNADKNAKRKPLSARRAVQAHAVLKQVLAFAIRTKRLATNPCDDIELPRVIHRAETALTHDEVDTLADTAGAAGPIVLTLAYTGLRFEELAALRVADVDLSRRRILVSKAVAQVTGAGLKEDTTKTHATRPVPILTEDLADTLAAAVTDRDGQEYLFPAPDDGPMRNSYFRWRFDKACAGAGLYGIRPKTLRHTAGSLALALDGTSVATVKRLLGHQDATTTLRVSSHMMPDDFENLAIAMDAARKSTSARRASGDPSHQNIPAEERRDLQLLIDGVLHWMVEVHYANQHAVMAYAEAGLAIPAGDLYVIEGFDRTLVKRAFSILLNASGRHRAVQCPRPQARRQGLRDVAVQRVGYPVDGRVLPPGRRGNCGH